MQVANVNSAALLQLHLASGRNGVFVIQGNYTFFEAVLAKHEQMLSTFIIYILAPLVHSVIIAAEIMFSVT